MEYLTRQAVVIHAGALYERIQLGRDEDAIRWLYYSKPDDLMPLAPHEQKLLEQQYQRQYDE